SVLLKLNSKFLWQMKILFRSISTASEALPPTFKTSKRKPARDPFPMTSHKEVTKMDFLIHHMLHSSAARYPDKDALIHESQRLSYSDVVRAVDGLAYSLTNLGV